MRQLLILIFLANPCSIISANRRKLKFKDWLDYEIEAPTPAALKSQNAVPYDFTELKISISDSCLLQMRNIGPTVISEPHHCRAAYLSGGPALEETYELRSVLHFNDAVASNTRVSTTEDGRGFPVQIQLVFCHNHYKTVEQSMGHSKSMIIIPFNIIVEGGYGTPSSKIYAGSVASVRKLNETTMFLASVLNWLLDTLDDNYYIYKGSYTDLLTGIRSFCALYISPGFSKHPFMSHEQFKDLRTVFDCRRNKQHRANPLAVYPHEGGSCDRQYWFPCEGRGVTKIEF